MVPHDAPNPPFHYDLNTEITALRDYRDTEEGRQIPQRRDDRLLLSTWNLTNLGVQARRDADYRLMAEIIGWFDLVAIQEVADDLAGLRALLAHLPDHRVVVSDPAGNDERLGFIYREDKIELLEMVGEVAVPPSDHRYIRLKGVSGLFTGFDRNPHIAAFRAGGFSFVLASVHLYFGNESWPAVDRRTLECYAVARWADLRHKKDTAYSNNIIVLGDFNLPKREKTDPVYRALTRKGLELPEHSTSIGSNLASDKNYDQIAFFPGPTKDRLTGSAGVFDFDGAIFREAWETRQADFEGIVKFHVADHRPLWLEFAI